MGGLGDREEGGEEMVEIKLGAVRFYPPERFEWRQEADHCRVTLMEVGDVTQICPPGQMVVRFSGFLPPGGYPYGEKRDSAADAEALREMLRDGKPRAFSAGGISCPISMEVTVEKQLLWEEPGDDGCIYYEIVLQEYRSAKAVATAVGNVRQDAVRAEEPQSAGRYQVKKGDTLWAIAKATLGDGSRYREIAQASGVKNPNLIYPGEILVIPEE